MSTPKDETPESGEQNRHFYPLLKAIASFADEQIDAWAEKFYDQIARDLNLGDSAPADQYSQQNDGESMQESLPPKIQRTDRFTTAVAYATTMHRKQTSKSTDIPYICHPLGVASFLIEAGCDEDQIIAGLVHVVPEDCGGEPHLEDIEKMFGVRVATIVRGCSDSLRQQGGKGSFQITKGGAPERT